MGTLPGRDDPVIELPRLLPLPGGGEARHVVELLLERDVARREDLTDLRGVGRVEHRQSRVGRRPRDGVCGGILRGRGEVDAHPRLAVLVPRRKQDFKGDLGVARPVHIPADSAVRVLEARNVAVVRADMLRQLLGLKVGRERPLGDIARHALVDAEAVVGEQRGDAQVVGLELLVVHRDGHGVAHRLDVDGLLQVDLPVDDKLEVAVDDRERQLHRVAHPAELRG